MTSLSIVFTAPRQVELREETVSDPGPGQILLRSLVSLISTGTEGFCYRGEFDADTGWANWVKYPFRPGYSLVGRVERLGAGVEGLKEGDRVFVGLPHQQFVTVAADPEGTIRVPEGVDEEEAAWSSLAVITQTAARQAEQAMGDTAAVIGAGPLGQMLVQYLRVIGLREVLAIDTVRMRLDRAVEHGATATYCGSAAEAGDFVREHTQGRLADVVYDVTGHWPVFPLALKLARKFGTVILLGDSPHPSRQHLTHDVLTRQLRVIGTQNENLPAKHAFWTRPRQIRLFYTYLQRGQVRAKDLLTHRFDPRRAAEAYDLLQEKRSETVGALFDWRPL